MPTKTFSEYAVVRAAVIAADIRTVDEYWSNYKSLPCSAPSRPYNVYGDQWKGWARFFGKKNMDSFDMVKECVAEAGLMSQSEYKKEFRNLPCKAPSCPNTYYGDQWVDWFDFLSKDPTYGYNPLAFRNPNNTVKYEYTTSPRKVLFVEVCNIETGGLSMHMVVVDNLGQGYVEKQAFDAVQDKIAYPSHLTIRAEQDIDEFTIFPSEFCAR